MASSVTRAFTTRRAKRQDNAGVAHKLGSSKSSYNIRDKISSPVELISTTNMLSYNAPDIFPGPSPSSDNDSLTSRGNFSSPPTSPDSSSIGSIPASPDTKQLSQYFTETKREEAPVVPQRSLTHTKSNHELVHRQRSLRVSSSKYAAPALPSGPAPSNHQSTSLTAAGITEERIPQDGADLPAAAQATRTGLVPSSTHSHTSLCRSISQPPQPRPSRDDSVSVSGKTSMSSRQNSMSSRNSHKGSVSSRSASSSRHGLAHAVSLSKGSTASSLVTVSRGTAVMSSPSEAAGAEPAAHTVQKMPPSPPPSRSLPDTPHPFGKELAEVTELAATYGTTLGVVDEEERDVVSRGCQKFTAQDYISEIQDLFVNAFGEVSRPAPLATAMWI